MKNYIKGIEKLYENPSPAYQALAYQPLAYQPLASSLSAFSLSASSLSFYQPIALLKDA
jgi:hypothetical protein